MTIKMLNFDFIGSEIKENQIKFSKQMSEIYFRIPKRKECLLCGKTSTIINSHSIPKFVLSKISENGELYSSASIIDAPILGDLKGLDKSGTFHILCGDCDNKWFADYENSENYVLNEPNRKMLAQIALKTYIKEIHKKQYEIDFFNDQFWLMPNVGIPENFSLDLTDSSRLRFGEKALFANAMKEEFQTDLDGFNIDFKYAKKHIESNGKAKGYYLNYYKKLDYLTPLAFQ